MAGDRTSRLRTAGRSLIAAYRQAMRQTDGKDILTKAEVARSIVDSGRGAVARLRTREEGLDDLTKEFETYIEAISREDWVKAGWNAGKAANAALLAAAGIGLTAGGLAGFAIDAIRVLADVGYQLGAAAPAVGLKVIGYPPLAFGLLRGLQAAYSEWEQSRQQPREVSVAASILARTVNPPEQAFYAITGGARPVRTFEAAGAGLAILAGLAVGIVTAGIVIGLTGALAAPSAPSL